MYRKIMGFLEAWKESEHRKPLILQGARQVGKTYSILEFGRTHYENVAYFNFETNPKLNETFDENISPDYLIPILSHIAGQTIVKEKTLIVFDEVQLCERALTSLKYFCENAPDYHIIVAGSLLGVAVNRAKFSFPVGKVDMKTLYPMDMEEFMLALGEDDLVEQIKKCFQTEENTVRTARALRRMWTTFCRATRQGQCLPTASLSLCSTKRPQTVSSLPSSLISPTFSSAISRMSAQDRGFSRSAVLLCHLSTSSPAIPSFTS